MPETNNSALIHSDEASLTKYSMIHKSYQFCIFVEDVNKEEFYYNLFSNILGFELDTRFYIFCLGGKKGVIDAFSSLKESCDETKNFYLVDGDFDLLVEKEMVDNENFYYLEKYDIESYLFDPNVLNSYLISIFKTTKPNIINQIKLGDILSDFYDSFSPLFLAFAAIQKMNLHPAPENVGLSIDQFLDLKNKKIDKDAIENFIKQISVKYSQFDKTYEGILKRYNDIYESNGVYIIDGKYLLRYLQLILPEAALNCGCKGRFEPNEYKFKAAHESRDEEFSLIKNRLYKSFAL